MLHRMPRNRDQQPLVPMLVSPRMEKRYNQPASPIAEQHFHGTPSSERYYQQHHPLSSNHITSTDISRRTTADKDRLGDAVPRIHRNNIREAPTDISPTEQLTFTRRDGHLEHQTADVFFKPKLTWLGRSGTKLPTRHLNPKDHNKKGIR